MKERLARSLAQWLVPQSSDPISQVRSRRSKICSRSNPNPSDPGFPWKNPARSLSTLTLSPPPPRRRPSNSPSRAEGGDLAAKVAAASKVAALKLALEGGNLAAKVAALKELRNSWFEDETGNWANVDDFKGCSVAKLVCCQRRRGRRLSLLRIWKNKAMVISSLRMMYVWTVLCIRLLCNTGEGVRKWMQSCRQSFARMLADKQLCETEQLKAKEQNSTCSAG